MNTSTSDLTSRIKTIVFIMGILFPLFMQAQYRYCENTDFYLQNFTNWIGHTSVTPHNTPGTNINIPYYYKQGIVTGRHTIITTSTPDPFTCGNLMTLPPGEKQCVRLGNGGVGSWGNGVGWQRDFLGYDIAVSPDNALLIYKYAVVLQDIIHDEVDLPKVLRPKLVVSLQDSVGRILDSICGLKQILADSALHSICKLDSAEKLGAKAANIGDIGYSQWTTVGLDLRPYIGKTIKLRFETQDCGLGAHFGYAYITAKCGKMKINASTCSPGGTVVLTAPEGFTYKWSPGGQTTQSISLSNTSWGDSASVELTSSTGCKIVLKTKLFQNVPTADFGIDSSGCAGEPIQFRDKSDGDTESWSWDFGDGTTAVVPNPVHVYSVHGIYPVRLIVKNSDGCVDTIIRKIEICKATSVYDEDQLLTVRVFPNPSTGLYKLEVSKATNGIVQLEIADLLGRIVYIEKTTIKNGMFQQEFDIKNQPEGIYFLRIKGTGYSKVLKLVKKE